MEDKMRYYDASRAVPENAQREFDNGSFKGTDINPMWRIKKLTEMFGPCGIGWFVEIISERCEEHGDVTIAIVDLNLYVKDNGEWSKPIFGTGGNKIRYTSRKRGLVISDEGYKMAFTDALSIACKSLGIGADIWYANDVTKYTKKQTEEEEPPKEFIPASQAQKNTIKMKCQPVQWAAMQQKYGENLEHLTAEKAGEALVKLKEAGA